ncbi:TIGR03032 family protein [Pseudovibrio brasiliensis]|uniref:TIGR03032 family protein n=1 Tax=Pseudovibrio brasiliensis TaxID=1898042 RepID=A0ABX8AX69_9HYPH|nr:TIGR03032 family protein [Pseudovibrio brasiliensis]QUS58341.1 TIGR03032 family protein [Pseudovibrio brasiliensis]
MRAASEHTGQTKETPVRLGPGDIACSRGLATWLSSHQVSLALSSYQTGQLFLVGVKPNGGIHFHAVGTNRAMGLWAEPQTLILATANQVIRFENILEENQRIGDADKYYVPRVAHTTGDLDIHDIVKLKDGSTVFANTMYSCLSTLHSVHSFAPWWTPDFISKLAAEDRCHLNGIALRGGKPAYVTMVSRADVVNGWRDRRDLGGCIIDVRSNEVVTENLSMPHSPRWHQGKLWVVNSGTGHLGWVDTASGAFQEVCFLPGFARGLSFHNGHAIVGLSLPRDGSFKGLPLDDELKKRDADPWCGVQIVNLDTGDVVEWIRFSGVVKEMLDVCTLPGVRLPSAASPTSPEVSNLRTIASTAKHEEPA